MLVRRLTAQTAPASTLPPAVSRVARPYFPPGVAVLCFFVTLRSHNTATPTPSRSTMQIVRNDSLSPPAEPFIPTSFRAICRGFVPDPAQLARSATPAPLGRPQAERLLPVLESGQSPSFHSGPSPASAVLINPVPLSMDRTAPHFVRHRTVHSAPFIVTLQRNRTEKTPAGSDSYCAPFPCRNKSRNPLPREKPFGNPGRDPGGPGNRPLLPTGYYPGHAPACPPAWNAPGNLSHSKLKTPTQDPGGHKSVRIALRLAPCHRSLSSIQAELCPPPARQSRVSTCLLAPRHRRSQPHSRLCQDQTGKIPRP